MFVLRKAYVKVVGLFLTASSADFLTLNVDFLSLHVFTFPEHEIRGSCP